MSTERDRKAEEYAKEVWGDSYSPENPFCQDDVKAFLAGWNACLSSTHPANVSPKAEIIDTSQAHEQVRRRIAIPKAALTQDSTWHKDWYVHVEGVPGGFDVVKNSADWIVLTVEKSVS
jgi:hypothetical protein